MFLLIAFVVCTKMANYVFPEAIRFPHIESWASERVEAAQTWYDNQPRFHSAPAGQRMVVVPGGFVYTRGPDDSVWTHAFNTYPLQAPGSKPAIYAAIASGSLAAADDLLRGQFDLPRFAPVSIDSASLWRADPYHDVYWRFYYYSLRPTVNLLVAFRETHDIRYAKALLAIDKSFFSGESASPYAWQDDHAVAFRGLVLAYEWWELRRLHALPVADSNAFLHELKKTGDFLEDPNHYQPEMNHGTNQSAALFQLGVDFPSLPGAAGWLRTARTRLAQSLEQIIDPDGTLIENSPYYHFYELDKMWQIYEFSLATKVPIASDFAARLSDMIRYATYILQPNDTVPLIGASLARTVRDNGTFADIAEADPAFRYVLTQGHSGTAPPNTSVTFKSSGETILRSAWSKGQSFVDAAYLTFNVGPYRTLHSHLNALAFTLYANGRTLLPDAGLYTYDPGPMFDYFHGTASHNTVVVDGKSQLEYGEVSAGPLVERDGLTYQSGCSSAYEGVTHLRTVIMLNEANFLVIDRLSSKRVHDYQQMFHLFPGAKLRLTGLTATGLGTTSQQSVTIKQLDPTGIGVQDAIGQTDPPAGLYSGKYGVFKPIHQLSYTQRGQNAAYTSLISVGPPDPRFSVSYDKVARQLTVRDKGRVLRIALGESAGHPRVVKVTHPKMPSCATTAIPGIAPWSKWIATGTGKARAVVADDDAGRSVLMLTATNGTEGVVDNALHGDLSASNLQLRLKVTGYARLSGLTLALSARKWSSAMSVELRDSYTELYAGEWMTVSLGRGSSLSGASGQWETHGSRFDWGAIDAVRITMNAKGGNGPPPRVEIESIRAIPQQRTGAVVFIFDDGYESIMPAAEYLHSHNMPADVAVIGKVIELPWRNYLNVFELRMLQNEWGWNIVNHSQLHKDAIAEYDSGNKLLTYEQDILDGALSLQREGLNSAPNWFIYPHGTTNAALEEVVGRFYTFARTTNESPEAFPFGSPLRVKTMEIHSPGDISEGSSTVLTKPPQVIAAVRDARRYHTTLILTLHRIRATPFDQAGYPLAQFKTIVDAVKKTGIPTMTLSELDAMNGVPQTSHIAVRPALPPLTTVTITDETPHHGFWSRLRGIF